MRLLLDAHALIWAPDDPSRLGQRAAAELRSLSNQLLLSAGTLWEVGIKFGRNKLTLSMPFSRWMTKAVADLNLEILPITLDHADVETGLPLHHRDPFDRLVVAQSLVEGVPVVSADAQLDSNGIHRIW